MRRTFSIILLAIIFPLLTWDFLYAGPGETGNYYGNSSVYRVTISKVEVSQDKVSWITLGEGAQEFNIASVSVGQQAGAYVSGKGIPVGTYRYVRVTVSRTMYISGSGVKDSTRYYTSAETVEGLGGSGQFGVATTTTNTEIATIVIPSQCPSPDPTRETLEVSGDNLIVTSTLEEPFTVTAGSGTLEINFHTQTTIEFDPDDVPGKIIFWPIPPICLLNIFHRR
jgi:hypothetical protein